MQIYDTQVVSRHTNGVIGAKPWFIMFHAPWCGNCTKLEPVWKAFAEANSELVNVGSIDCTVQEMQPLRD